MSESTFEGILERRAPRLYAHYEDMVGRAQEDWVHLLKPDHGSHSGMIHLRNVQRCADKMIPTDRKHQFSDGEIFVLLASILLHDLGRIIPDRPRMEVSFRWPLGTSDPRSFRLVDNSSEYCPLARGQGECTDSDRDRTEQKTHACRTKHLIDLCWPHFGLPDEPVARICGLVAFCHQLVRPPGTEGDAKCGPAREFERSFAATSLEPYGRIRVPLLASIVRLADETEDSWARAIRQHWYEQLLKVDSADLYKAFRRGIDDVEFCAEARCIIMHMHLEQDSKGRYSDAFLDQLKNKVDDSRRVIRAWGELLEPAGVKYEFVLVQQDGRLSRYPGMPTAGWPPLADALEKAVEGKGALLQEQFVPSGTVQRYFQRLESLVRGTWEYRTYRWSSIEAAIGEPLDAQRRWVIRRMGRIHPGLIIQPRDDQDEVEIRFGSPEEREVVKRQLGVGRS